MEEIQKVYKSQKINNTSIYPGDLKRSPDESFFGETLIFIDETFLEKLSKHFGNGKYLKFDKILFAENLAKKQKLNCQGIFYYTAPPFQCEIPTSEEEKKKQGYNRFINKLKEKGVIVREGRCQRLKGDENFIYKQKAVDILLAMDLMSVPLDYPKVKRIILISSDSDFVPIVQSLEEKGVKTILYTYYEKVRDTEFSVSNHLIKLVHKYVLLTKNDFDNSPLKKIVEKKKRMTKMKRNNENLGDKKLLILIALAILILSIVGFVIAITPQEEIINYNLKNGGNI